MGRSCKIQCSFCDIDGRLYGKRDGVIMGSPLGPTFASFYMYNLENKAFRSLKMKTTILESHYWSWSVFFDLEKHTIWRSVITFCRTCMAVEERFYFSKMLQWNLLCKSVSWTYIGPKTTDYRGVIVQRSVTLFALNINSIAPLMPDDPRFISSLYVDDLQIGFPLADFGIIQDKTPILSR